MTKAKKQFQLLESNEICLIYNFLYQDGEISFPLNQNAQFKIDAVVGNITGEFFGTELYPSIEEKVVAYLWFIVKAHAFTDGNKRTAVTVFYVLARRNNLDLNPEWADRLDEMATWIEAYKQEDYQQLIYKIAQLVFR